MESTQDLRVGGYKKLLSPRELMEALPITQKAKDTVVKVTPTGTRIGWHVTDSGKTMATTLTLLLFHWPQIYVVQVGEGDQPALEKRSDWVIH